MKQYNIYAGLNGSFGGAKYKFTSLCETEDEAYEEAFQAACEDYESYSIHGLPNWEDAINAYCKENEINTEDFEETDDNSQEIEEYFNEARENWLSYYAVPTDEDDIDPEDLIIGYVIEDDNTSQADSE